MPTITQRSSANYCTLRHGRVHYVVSSFHLSRPPTVRRRYTLSGEAERRTVISVCEYYHYHPDRAEQIQNYFDTHCVPQ